MHKTIGLKLAPLVTFAVLSAFHSFATAETISKEKAAQDERFRSLALSQPVLDVSAAFAQKYDEILGLAKNCASRGAVVPGSLDVLQDLVLPTGAKAPVSGAWTLRYTVNRCGNTKTYNTIYVLNSAGQIVPKPYIVGTTLANLNLVNDVMLPVKAAAVTTSGQKACANVHVLDTRVTSSPSKSGVATSWTEDWDVQVCGKNFRVPVKFEATKDGGADYNISLPSVKPL